MANWATRAAQRAAAAASSSASVAREAEGRASKAAALARMAADAPWERAACELQHALLLGCVKHDTIQQTLGQVENEATETARLFGEAAGSRAQLAAKKAREAATGARRAAVRAGAAEGAAARAVRTARRTAIANTSDRAATSEERAAAQARAAADAPGEGVTAATHHVHQQDIGGGGRPCYLGLPPPPNNNTRSCDLPPPLLHVHAYAAREHRVAAHPPLSVCQGRRSQGKQDLAGRRGEKQQRHGQRGETRLPPHRSPADQVMGLRRWRSVSPWEGGLDFGDFCNLLRHLPSATVRQALSLLVKQGKLVDFDGIFSRTELGGGWA